MPVSCYFFEEFEKNQHTYKEKYSFMSLKIMHDTWPDDLFFKSYYMWDSFLSGVATSIMRKMNNGNGKNEFAEMDYKNITVITSNEQYGISDGSSPFFEGLEKPKFNLTRGGVHSGQVQTGLRDPFCVIENGKGRCEDGYTEEVTGRAGVRVLAAGRAKRNRDKNRN